jgi:hypothetical protein
MTDDELRKLVREIRAITRMPHGHSFKRRKAESHRKVWGFPPLTAKTRRERGRG